MDGLIVKALSGFYYVQTEEGTVIECRARGKLRKTQMSPLVGDRVTIAVEGGKGTVQEVLPRRNRFVRPAVANLDALVVLASCVIPVTEPFLIDRVAAIAGDQGVAVYLCVNKCDLDPAGGLVPVFETPGFPGIRPRRQNAGGGGPAGPPPAGPPAGPAGRRRPARPAHARAPGPQAPAGTPPPPG